MLTAVHQHRLQNTVRLLLEAGCHNPVLTAASRTTADKWNPGLTRRLVSELHALDHQVRAVGIDPVFLPTLEQIDAHCPPTPTSAAPALSAPSLSAEAVLAAVSGTPLQCDNTLDGLRGVPLTDLDGLSRAHAAKLAAAGIVSVFDLLMRVPRQYIDRTELRTLAELEVGMQQVPVVAKVESTSVNHEKRVARILLSDGTHRLLCVFFNAEWQARRFTRNDHVLVQGDVGEWQGNRQMVSPLIEPLAESTAPLLPVYPESPKHEVTTWIQVQAATMALGRITRMDDPLPTAVREQRGLMTRLDALRAVHIPDTADMARSGRDRLAYDELVRLQLALGVRRAAQRAAPSVQHSPTAELTGALIAGLPYPLTAPQRRAVATITADLAASQPMNRLLQGDVGAGKTLVCLVALLAAVEGGHQAALMAPTEILATQHHAEISRLVQPLGLQVGLLVSRVRTKARRATAAALSDGTLPLVVGTHALLAADVEFASLGLVVIDEQHRFGVQQRALLLGKGPSGVTPDLLVATATPIPRTAAMTAFGDLDLVTLDDMPPGRSPIHTTWQPDITLDATAQHAPPWDLVRSQVAAGRQAYVVCPLVEESEKAQAAAAEKTTGALRDGALRGLRIGMVTGRQRPDERAAVMQQFTNGDLDVLVATTVIEVGVNVLNASVIVVLDAPRFGLAQLHQLRGRVGRGRHPGFCVLTGAASDIGAARMTAMCSTNDGFVLSETDLRLRGPGALAGTAQAGHRAGLLVADLLADAELMANAREDARLMLDADPFLRRRPQLRREVELALGEDADWLLRS